MWLAALDAGYFSEISFCYYHGDQQNRNYFIWQGSMRQIRMT